MASPLLDIQSLSVTVEDKTILENLSLTVYPGELHVLMGPNGTGKSTLVSSIMGDPRYTVTGGQMLFDGQDITHLTPDARARLGIFLSFQTPQEIPGVTLEDFLRTAKEAVTGERPKVMAFRKELTCYMENLGLPKEYVSRYVNVGFSGGEKKKAEMLQLLALKPRLALLDETDSGLDVDAVHAVARAIQTWHDDQNSLIIITHNARILDGLHPDHVHVLEGKKIGLSGGEELIHEITEGGFAGLTGEVNKDA